MTDNKLIMISCHGLIFEETVLEPLTQPQTLGGALISLAVDTQQPPSPGDVVVLAGGLVTRYAPGMPDVLGGVCGGSWAKQ